MKNLFIALGFLIMGTSSILANTNNGTDLTLEKTTKDSFANKSIVVSMPPGWTPVTYNLPCGKTVTVSVKNEGLTAAGVLVNIGKELTAQYCPKSTKAVVRTVTVSMD